MPVIGIGKANKGNQYISVPKQCWLTGQIDAEIAKHIIDIHSKSAEMELSSVEVLLIPRIDVLKSVQILSIVLSRLLSLSFRSGFFVANLIQIIY